MVDPGLSLTCSHCRKRFRIKNSTPGRLLRCPTPDCGNTLVIPSAVPPVEVLDLDDAPAPPPRRRPAVSQDWEEERERPGKSPLLWLGLAAACVLVVGVLGGVTYWLRSNRTAEDAIPAGSENAADAFSNRASGPRLTLLEKPPESINVRHYYLLGEFHRGEGDRFAAPVKDWPQTLPTGTESVHIGLVFGFEPPDGTRLEVEISNDSGPVKLRGGGLMLTIRSPEGMTVELTKELESGAFPDGRYKAKVKIDGKPTAELNWAVGARVKGVPASSLKGSKWYQSGSPDSGYQFDFGADGTLKVEASWDRGRLMVGKWEANGETITGHVETPDGMRTEYRGQCLKDEIWMRSRTGKGNSWYALGVLVKEGELGVEVPRIPDEPKEP